MKTTAEIVEILRDYKARSAEKYGIEMLGLFGSVAHHAAVEPYFRAVVDASAGCRTADTIQPTAVRRPICVFVKLRIPDFFVRMKIKEELEHLFHTKIDLIPIFETMRALLQQNIKRDAIYI